MIAFSLFNPKCWFRNKNIRLLQLISVCEFLHHWCYFFLAHLFSNKKRQNVFIFIENDFSYWIQYIIIIVSAPSPPKSPHFLYTTDPLPSIQGTTIKYDKIRYNKSNWKPLHQSWTRLSNRKKSPKSSQKCWKSTPSS